MPANDYPGAKYIIPGFCGKFLKTARKNGDKTFSEGLNMNA
jgi:hypothetical protein